MVSPSLWLLLLLNSCLERGEAQGFGMNLIKVPEADRGQIICTVSLITKYFRSGESLSGSLLHVSTTSASAHLQKLLLEALHANNEYPWSIVVKDVRGPDDGEYSDFVLQEKPQCYFMVIESMEDEDMDETFENWKSNVNWNPLAQFVVYLSTVEETEEEMTDIMIEVLLNFMNKKIYNVNVIGQNEEESYYYGKTVFPYHPDNNCGNRVITIETLDICDYQEGEKDEDDEEIDYDEEEEGGGEGEGEEDYKNEEHRNNDEGPDTNQSSTETQENDDPKEPLEEQEKSGESETDKTSTPMSKESNADPQTTREPQESAVTNTSQETTNLPTDEEPDTDQSSTETQEKDDLKEPLEEKEKTGESETDKTSTPMSKESNEDHQTTREPQESETANTSQETTNLAAEEEEVEFFNETNSNIKSLPFVDSADDEEYPKLYIQEMYRALFLDKFPKDLSGCPLVAAYRPWEPYIFKYALDNTVDYTSSQNNSADPSVDYDDDDDGLFDYKSYEDQLNSDADMPTGSVEIHLNGIEYKMIQTIGERLHISIDLQVENTNVYHLFQQLIDGDIEMVIGGIDEDPSISQYVSSTVPYHQDDLTWCVAKARRSHNLFNFMATFEARAWILTIIFILTASFSILMSQKFLKIRQTVLTSYFAINVYVMGIILSQAFQLPRVPTSLKLCFGSTFFMGLIFSNVYQSFLISTLTTPKSSYQISHTEEIYENRMNVMGSVDNVRHLSKKGETFRYVREHFQMCYNIEECLQHAATDAKLAVAVSRLHSFYNPRIPRDNLYCFDRDENIYVYLVTMLLPKKFHLLHKINPVIQHIIESGHMQKWARDLDMRRKIIEEIQRAHEEPFNSLTLAQVVGPFALSGLLLGLALWIFLMERLIYWMVVRRRTRIKIAKYLHRKLV